MRTHPIPLSRALAAILFAWTGLASAGPCIQPLKVGLADRGVASYRTPSGYGGISVEILQELSRRAGCGLEFTWLPSARLMLELRLGKIDIAATMLRAEERDTYAQFLPYGYTQNYLVSTRFSGRQYTSLESFWAQSASRLNVVRGLMFSPGIEAKLMPARQQGRVEEVKDFETLFRKMAAGRAEAAVMSPWVYQWYARRSGLAAQLNVVAIPEYPQPRLGMYLSRASIAPDVASTLAATLQKMLSDGTVLAIFSRYMDEAEVKQLFASGTAALASDGQRDRRQFADSTSPSQIRGRCKGQNQRTKECTE